MLDMAERKGKGRPRKDGRKPSKKNAPRSGKPLNVWIGAPLRDALDAMIAKSRRSLTSEVSIALEEYLAKQGFWPPPDESPPPTQ
jgi:hypothetical protein